MAQQEERTLFKHERLLALHKSTKGKAIKQTHKEPQSLFLRNTMALNDFNQGLTTSTNLRESVKSS